MSADKHSPWRVSGDAGQWGASHYGTGCSAYVAVKAEDEVVALAVAHTPDPFGEVGDVNGRARLIAAAPRLLAALDALHRRYVQAIGNEGPEAAEARCAIAEARGIQP